MNMNLSDTELEGLFESLGYGVCREDIAVTTTTVAEFDAASRSAWLAFDRRSEDTSEAGLRVVVWTKVQTAKGQPRKDLVVVDLGNGQTAAIRA